MENIKKFPDFQDETPEYAGETKPRISWVGEYGRWRCSFGGIGLRSAPTIESAYYIWLKQAEWEAKYLPGMDALAECIKRLDAASRKPKQTIHTIHTKGYPAGKRRVPRRAQTTI